MLRAEGMSDAGRSERQREPAAPIRGALVVDRLAARSAAARRPSRLRRTAPPPAPGLLSRVPQDQRTRAAEPPTSVVQAPPRGWAAPCRRTPQAAGHQAGSPSRPDTPRRRSPPGGRTPRPAGQPEAAGTPQPAGHGQGPYSGPPGYGAPQGSPSGEPQPGGYGNYYGQAQPGGYGQTQPGGYGQPQAAASPGDYGQTQPGGYGQPPAGGYAQAGGYGPGPYGGPGGPYRAGRSRRR